MTQNAIPKKPERNKAHFLVMGIGNDFRGDDGFGLAVARALQPQLGEHHVQLGRGDASELLETFDQTDCLILIDAIFDPKMPSGHMLHIVANGQSAVSNHLRSSTHLMSISEAIALGELFDKLPSQLHIFGVSAKKFDYGTDLSPEVKATIAPTCVKIADLIQALQETAAPSRQAPVSQHSMTAPEKP